MKFTLLDLRSIKARVTFSTLAIFVFSLWALSFFTSHMLQDDMQRMLGEQQFSTVSFIAAQVNDELRDRVAALELIGIDEPSGRLAGAAGAATDPFDPV